MAKRTAVIDIGSNSARMAIYEKETRFSFHLIKEIKSRVRIGEGAYEKDGYLQPPAIKRAHLALGDFLTISKMLSCNKVLCVATSALRDAANSKKFIKDIKKEYGFDIKVIDGNQEAYYGAVAVANMLSSFEEATTIDIGGGSTELAKIKDGIITKTISINIGTVRLKELFFDKNASIEKITKFINKELLGVDKEFFSPYVIGIGGTLRALSKLFMEKSNYPLNTIHNYEYKVDDFLPLINKIASCKTTEELGAIGVKKDRYDTIREGSIIFKTILNKLGAKRVITSGVGVREGVYLCDLLRTNHHRLPPNYLLSLETLRARFLKNSKESNYIAKSAGDLFDVLAPVHQINDAFRHELVVAGKLSSIGRILNFYQENLHGSYFILNSLNYGFSHKQKILISTIIKYDSKKITLNEVKVFKDLLPDITTLNWLIFLLSLSKILYTNCSLAPIRFEYKNHSLHIISKSSLYLARDLIKRLSKPSSFAIITEQE